MRLLLVLLLLLLGSASTAEAASWIERSYAGLLVDAEAVVTGQVGEVSRHRAAFRVEGVLSGDPGLAGRTLALPVVRCNESGPDGVTSYIFEPIAVTQDNVADTVIADGFYDASDICTGDYAKACQEAGIS